MSKVTVLCIASLAIGAGVGWMLHGEQQASAPSLMMAATQPAARAPLGVHAVGSIEIEQLRAVIREELTAVKTVASNSSAAPQLKEVATVELVAKRRTAAEEIETMIRGGQWGNEQRTAFHQRIGLLDADQGARLLREVTMAIDNGSLQMTTNGPPL